MGRRPERVAVACAVCKTEFTVKPSRAAQNNAITCSRMCLAELRRRNIIKYRGSGEARVTTCAACGDRIERKPSQIAKYKDNYCDRECRARGIRGPRPASRTGEWADCETCGKPVWRTPATRQKHTYCSHACVPRISRGPRIARIVKPCGDCGSVMSLTPSRARQIRYCSMSCAARYIQGAKRGQPGLPWGVAQRARLSVTLRHKYRHEWAEKRVAHSVLMTGTGNPQWRGGRRLLPYTPGFTRTVKRLVAERDGQQCQRCGAPRGHGTHAVHHIDGSKTNHALANLVLLCRRCHGIVHCGVTLRRSAPDPR